MMNWDGGNGWHQGMGWGGWFAMGLIMILVLALVIWGTVALVRFMIAPSRRTQHVDAPTPTLTPEGILATRFARGEISEEEYARRRETLTASTVQSGGLAQ